MKKTLLAVMAVLMMSVMLIAGCSSGEEAAPAADKKSGTTTIGFSISTLNNPFFVSVKDGVEAKAKELGVNVKIVDAQNDPAKQANDVADLLQQGVSVLLVNPVDSAAISTSVEAANKAKIPVIALDRSADKGTIVQSFRYIIYRKFMSHHKFSCVIVD